MLPLQHTYVPDDHRTCREFDLPVVLSGHDHHRVDEVVAGTRLLKPGLDAIYATVLEIAWDDPAAPRGSAPSRVAARFERVDGRADDDAPPRRRADPALAAEAAAAYAPLAPLRNTELARVPRKFRPLSSAQSRARVTTMGALLCTLLRVALNTDPERDGLVDGVLLMGGNVRGGREYAEGGFFSLEALEAEVKADETVGVVEMPGWLLSEGVRATHRGEPIPGWMQYGDGIEESDADDAVVRVAGRPLERERVYRIATKVADLTNGQSPPFAEYYTAHPEALPPKGAYVNVHAALMGFFSRNLWRRVWEAAGGARAGGARSGGAGAERVMRALDRDGDGEVSVREIHAALAEVLGVSVDDAETSLAECVHRIADATGEGVVTLEDLRLFAADASLFADAEDAVEQRLMAEEVQPAWL